MFIFHQHLFQSSNKFFRINIQSSRRQLFYQQFTLWNAHSANLHLDHQKGRVFNTTYPHRRIRSLRFILGFYSLCHCVMLAFMMIVSLFGKNNFGAFNFSFRNSSQFLSPVEISCKCLLIAFHGIKIILRIVISSHPIFEFFTFFDSW